MSYFVKTIAKEKAR